MATTDKKILIIGSGIAGLASACLLSKKGFEVEIFEKNDQVGGRASIFEVDGYKFDMGPSWYMMSDVFERFFELVGENITDYLELEKLEPSYRIFLEGREEPADFYSDMEKNKALFELEEPGAGEKLEQHIANGKFQYEVAKNEFMFKNYDSIFDFVNKRVMTEGRKLPLFKSMEAIINKQFSSSLLRKALQYQTVLLGTSPKECPGIYSLMNHVDFGLGIWYPKGGMYEVTKALAKVAEKNGVKIHTSSPVKKIQVENNKTTGVLLEDDSEHGADIVISNADLAHTDLALLGIETADRDENYWKKKKMTPSGFIMYLGVDGKIDSLLHHNLYFIEDWERGNKDVFDGKKLPEDPSYYVCCPSKTDDSVAPEGKENLFVLVPIANGIEYTDEEMKAYGDTILENMAAQLDIPNLQDRVEYRRDYCVKDFEKDYNAYKGNALSGMAHMLKQTAFFRPNNTHSKIDNLYFAGAGTNPGVGVPICLISAELVYKRIIGNTSPHPLENL